MTETRPDCLSWRLVRCKVWCSLFLTSCQPFSGVAWLTYTKLNSALSYTFFQGMSVCFHLASQSCFSLYWNGWKTLDRRHEPKSATSVCPTMWLGQHAWELHYSRLHLFLWSAPEQILLPHYELTQDELSVLHYLIVIRWILPPCRETSVHYFDWQAKLT